MNISIHDIKRDGEEMEFTVKNCDVSIINALRRTIIAHIPCVVFRTTPYEKSNVTITENTSRLNNEIIKQRLSCIPIHIDNLYNGNDYLVELNEENNTNSMKYVTTEHFNIKNTSTDKYLDRTEVKRIFPKNKLTNEYILITRLRPSLTNDTDGEKISLSGTFDTSSANEDGCFNVASMCAYGMKPDLAKQNAAWLSKEKELKDSGLSDSEVLDEKENWYNHDAKRIYEKDSFIFKLETIGVYSCDDLVATACNIMSLKLSELYTNLDERENLISNSDTLMNGFDFRIDNDDYSIGKSLEYVMYKQYYEDEKIIDFVGFRKFHPHDDYSVLRISFKDETVDEATAKNYLQRSIQEVVQLFTSIQSEFTKS